MPPLDGGFQPLRDAALQKDFFRSLLRGRIKEPYQPEGTGGHQGGGWYGYDPGPDDAGGDSPADGGEAIDGSYADDRSGDSVGGAHGDSG
jgi:hypothetical protein